MDDIIEVICGILINDQKVLIAQRGPSMTLPLKWEFPGGKKDPEESEVDCLKRELLEELNILVEVKEKFMTSHFKYSKVTIALTAYLVEYKSGTVLLIEHNKCKWVSRNDIEGFDWADADIPIVTKLVISSLI